VEEEWRAVSAAYLAAKLVPQEDLDYTSNMMDAGTTKAAATDFDLLQGLINGSAAEVFTVRGDGREWSETRTVNGLLTAPSFQSAGAVTIPASGLLTSGGLTVTAGGLAVKDGPSAIVETEDSSALTVSQTATVGYASSVLTVEATQVRAVPACESGVVWCSNRSLGVCNAHACVRVCDCFVPFTLPPTAHARVGSFHFVSFQLVSFRFDLAHSRAPRPSTWSISATATPARRSSPSAVTVLPPPTPVFM